MRGVLIASPSDVEEEREIAVRVIQEWNDLYSYSRKVVLLPVRWETHTAPEYGARPQEIINRAIVDNCDLLLGVFWTRIGTPTGNSDSGTLEEITRVAKAGKPIMLYFSHVGMDPERIGLGQLARLNRFKEETSPNALTESYKSHIEFRDKLSKQLELKVRDLQKADDVGQPPPLKFALATNQASDASVVEVDFIDVEDREIALSNESEEVRQRVLSAVDQQTFSATLQPIFPVIANTGSSGIRNLYVEVSVKASTELVELIERSISSYQPLLGWAQYGYTKKLSKLPDGWKFSFEWDALQPQRTRFIDEPSLWV